MFKILFLSSLIALTFGQQLVTPYSVQGYFQKGPDGSLLTNEPLQPFCYITRLKPFKPQSIPPFCYAYSDSSCCLPQMEYDMQQMWDQYFYLGKGCMLTHEQPPGLYQPIWEFWCLGCDPNNYKYINIINLNSSQPQIVFNICQSFADRLWPRAPNSNNSYVYDDCGFSVPSPCGYAPASVGTPWAGQMFQDGDPFECGNNIVIPSVDFASVDGLMNGNAVTGAISLISPEMDNMGNIMFQVVPDNGPAGCFAGFNAAWTVTPSFAAIFSFAIVAMFLL